VPREASLRSPRARRVRYTASRATHDEGPSTAAPGRPRSRSVLPVNLLTWPAPYPSNPYIGRLHEALARRGVRVRAARRLAALVPARGAWLHVHWPEWMLRDRSRARAWGRALWFFALVDSFRARGVRIAWTAHNLLGHDEPHADLALRFRRAWLARCALVHGHFASAEQSVRELGFRGRFVLAGHPHAGDDYAPTQDRASARARWGLDDAHLALLSYGAIETYKGFDRVARAFVRDAPSHARWIVAGRASSPDALASLRAAVGGDPRVRIEPGFLSPAQSADLMLAADALVLGYRAFFTSGTAMLALTMGTPVLGPAEHHLAQLEGEAFFTRMDDPESLSSALASLRGRPQDPRPLARAWAARFTYDGLAEALATAFAEGA
jgi:beta-1,4-mannosyltransferase